MVLIALIILLQSLDLQSITVLQNTWFQTVCLVMKF